MWLQGYSSRPGSGPTWLLLPAPGRDFILGLTAGQVAWALFPEREGPLGLTMQLPLTSAPMPLRNGYQKFSQELLSNGELNHLPLKERMVEIGSRWQRISQSQKDHYKKLAEEQQKQYKVHLDIWLKVSAWWDHLQSRQSLPSGFGAVTLRILAGGQGCRSWMLSLETRPPVCASAPWYLQRDSPLNCGSRMWVRGPISRLHFNTIGCLYMCLGVQGAF